MPRVGTAYVSIRAKLDKLDKDLNDAKSLTIRAANSVQRSVSNVFKGAVAVFGIQQMSKFASEVYNVGREVARLEKAFQEISGGSVAAATQEFEYLRDVSKELGQNFYDLANEYKGLLAASKDTALEGRGVRDVFYGIARAGATLGLSSEDMKFSLYAVQQMMSKGKISAEELRRQLGERLPGAFNLAAEAIGVSTAELDKMLKEGKVVSEDFLPKFARLLQERYSGSVDDATMATNKLNEAWKDFMVALSSRFLPIANEAKNALSDIFSGAADFLQGPSLEEQLAAAEERLARLRGESTKTSEQLAKDWASSKFKIGPFFSVDSPPRPGEYSFKTTEKTAEESYRDRLIRQEEELISKLRQRIELGKLVIDIADFPNKIAQLSLIEPEQSQIIKEVDQALTEFFGHFDSNAYSDRIQEIDIELSNFFGDMDRKGYAEQIRLIDNELNNFFGDLDREKIKSFSDDMSNAFTGWGASFSATLNDMLWGAETTFEDILKSFGKMISQMLIQKAVIEPLFNAIGGSFSGGSTISGRASGGPVSPYETYLVGENGPEILQMGSRGGYVHPGAGGGIVVNNKIINNAGVQVTQREEKTPQGVDLLTIIDNAQASNLSRRGSASNRALRNNYGAGERLISRG